ncbi:MAG: TetR/AcrR family transcriptional regulator [Proteobacteria bacterium]|nr:TetR/AcrR family transcriptional regulator [Pseudomonadota bacterium]
MRRRLARVARSGATERRKARSGAALLTGDPIRTRILQGGGRVLAAKGLAATTVQHVLRAAGVSRRTFYQWFADMEALLDALFELATDRLLQTVRQAAEQTGDPVARLEAAVTAYLELQRAFGPLAVVLQSEAMRPESRLAPRREAAIEAFVQLYVAGISRAQERRIDPLVLRALVLTAEGICMHLLQDSEFSDADAQRARAVILAIARRVLALDASDLVPLPLADEANGKIPTARNLADEGAR